MLKDQEGDLEQRFFFKQGTHNGPGPWPSWCFHENTDVDKFKTVYKQANLLLVCGHVSYKGNAKVAGSQ